MKLLFVVLCSVVLVFNAADVESRRHSDGDSGRRYKRLFVFGDEYADTGNYPRSELTSSTRAWYWPYGSDDRDHGTRASGRFSNGLVLSDFVARILGPRASPPPASQREQNGVDPSGMNFAVGGAGVVQGTSEAPNLGTQIDKFSTMVKNGIIDKDLKHSVALIAFSGKHDYAGVMDKASSGIEEATAQHVTDKIAEAVEQLMKLGVQKLLVTSLPPLGCTPWLSSSHDYNSCDDSHKVASIHNVYLKKKVFKYGAVFNLDLKAAFTHLVVDHNSGSQSQKFKNKLDPCCLSIGQGGYCGQMKGGKQAQYMVCAEPDIHFYWDDINPTQAGWKAVMEEVQEPIKNFLDT